MSAPETIWANPYYGIQPHQTAGLWKLENTNSLGTQYTRSDLCITRAEADAMVAAERERCARVADDEFGGRMIAAKIRGDMLP